VALVAALVVISLLRESAELPEPVRRPAWFLVLLVEQFALFLQLVQKCAVAAFRWLAARYGRARFEDAKLFSIHDAHDAQNVQDDLHGGVVLLVVSS